MGTYSATFSKFGTLAARAMFENGDVAKAFSIQTSDSKLFEFHIEFKPRMSSFKTRPVLVTPTMVVHLQSEEVFKAQLAIYQEQSKLKTVTRRKGRIAANQEDASRRGVDRWSKPGSAI
jgi:hypothetical protein